MDRANFFRVDHCRWRHCVPLFFDSNCFGVFRNRRRRVDFDFGREKTIQFQKMAIITKKGRHDGRH